MEYQELLDLARSLNVTEADLIDEVHATARARAEAVNDEGTESQLRFLLDYRDAEDVENVLRVVGTPPPETASISPRANTPQRARHSVLP